MLGKTLVERMDKFTQATLTSANAIGQEGTAYEVFGGAVYFTIKPSSYKGKRYCFVYCNTHSIAKAFETRKEVEMFLSEQGF